MSDKEHLNAKVVREYLIKFPNTPNLTLAKKIYKDHPKLFKGVENVRSMIRDKTGNSGAKNRVCARDKSLHTEPKPKNPFNIPPSYSNDFSPYIISQSKTLIISDTHFPYQDNKAIELALQYGLDKNVTCILINGDLVDFATISRHEKDFRARDVGEEFESVRIFLKTLRDNFPNAKIVYKMGNHCERWEKWLYVKAPELFNDPEFQLEHRFRLAELGIEIVKDKRPIKIGKLTILHGHELAGGSGGVNPARATFLKTLDSVLVGHYHKTSQHTETTMGGEVISVNSVGCLCGLNPLYMPINKHNLGFAYCELSIKTGEYNLENLKIIKGKIY